MAIAASHTSYTPLAHSPSVRSGSFQPLPIGVGSVPEGAVWGAFWVSSLYFFVDSASKLYKTWTVQNPAMRQIEKVGLAVKNAVVDLLSFLSSSAYVVLWAATSGLISVGRFLPWTQGICVLTSLLMHSVEGGADIYSIWSEKNPKQNLHYHGMRLMSNISLVAWAALGIIAFAGTAVSSTLMTTLLAVGCVFGAIPIFYRPQSVEG